MITVELFSGESFKFSDDSIVTVYSSDEDELQSYFEVNLKEFSEMTTRKFWRFDLSAISVSGIKIPVGEIKSMVAS